MKNHILVAVLAGFFGSADASFSFQAPGYYNCVRGAFFDCQKRPDDFFSVIRDFGKSASASLRGETVALEKFSGPNSGGFFWGPSASGSYLCRFDGNDARCSFSKEAAGAIAKDYFDTLGTATCRVTSEGPASWVCDTPSESTVGRIRDYFGRFVSDTAQRFNFMNDKKRSFSIHCNDGICKTSPATAGDYICQLSEKSSEGICVTDGKGFAETFGEISSNIGGFLNKGLNATTLWGVAAVIISSAVFLGALSGTTQSILHVAASPFCAVGRGLKGIAYLGCNAIKSLGSSLFGSVYYFANSVPYWMGRTEKTFSDSKGKLVKPEVADRKEKKDEVGVGSIAAQTSVSVATEDTGGVAANGMATPVVSESRPVASGNQEGLSVATPSGSVTQAALTAREIEVKKSMESAGASQEAAVAPIGSEADNSVKTLNPVEESANEDSAARKILSELVAKKRGEQIASQAVEKNLLKTLQGEMKDKSMSVSVEIQKKIQESTQFMAGAAA